MTIDLNFSNPNVCYLTFVYFDFTWFYMIKWTDNLMAIDSFNCEKFKAIMLDNPGFAAYGSLIFCVICFVLNIATLCLFIRRPKEAVDCSQSSGPRNHRRARKRLVEKRFTITAVIMFFGQSIMAIYMVNYKTLRRHRWFERSNLLDSYLSDLKLLQNLGGRWCCI